MTNIVTSINQWREIRNTIISQIGFIPTMGHLHDGHLSLCRQACSENDITVVSIFVNPTQFNQNDDFDNYPRTLAEDIDKLTQEKVDYVLVFESAELYPDNYEIKITESELSRSLEGAYRPGHFTGVLTIVLKFINLVNPARAYFGEKDYQQLLLIKKMVAALFIPTEIVACQTVRSNDQLALSSRNSRLTPEQRQLASRFPQILQSPGSAIEIIEQLQNLGFKIDYITERWQRRLGAVWLGDVRLIDNIALEA